MTQVLHRSDIITNPDTIATTVARIEAIPDSEMPDRSARRALVELTRLGGAVTVQSSPEGDGTLIWLASESQDDPYMTCDEWTDISQQDTSEQARETLLVELADYRLYLLLQACLVHQDPENVAKAEEFERLRLQVRNHSLRLRYSRWYRLVTQDCRADAPAVTSIRSDATVVVG